MGIYLNPSNDLFYNDVTHSPFYIDKTMLIDNTNRMMFGVQKHICISRPRRFGKSMAANMLVAYYSRGADSRELFSKLKICQTADFEKHLNKYNVFYFDIRSFASKSQNIDALIRLLDKKIIGELKAEFSDVEFSEDYSSDEMLMAVYYAKKNPFVFIIDEWDCVFRVFRSDSDGQNAYLNYLRTLLKDKPYVALDYATGIFPIYCSLLQTTSLFAKPPKADAKPNGFARAYERRLLAAQPPSGNRIAGHCKIVDFAIEPSIKKYGEHSALNMYNEYTMQTATPFSEFVGFTEEEVEGLCERYGLSPDEMKKWYNGYVTDGISVYNPQSVVSVCTRGVFANYWTQTETYEALKDYICLNFDGLRDKITDMIAGGHIKIDTTTFVNDMVNFSTADDILTLLVHLGYLTYDFATKEAWIPNYEVREQFISTVRVLKWQNVTRLVQASAELLNATLAGDSEKVAQLIEAAHENYTSVLRYNDENALACVITLAYYAAQDDYVIHRELATGKGFADIALIPRKLGTRPAVVIELKHNNTADAAIAQIKARNYPQKLMKYSGEILLVGISYDDDKGHSCVIERIVK